MGIVYKEVTTMMRSKAIRIAIPSLLLFASLVLLAGCGGGGGGSSSSAVSVTNVGIGSNSILPGDTVTIDADVITAVGVSSVQAKITEPNGTVSTVSMSLKSGTASTYEGAFNDTTQPGTYTGFVTAQDLNNASGQSGKFTFSVEGPPPPPSY